MKNLLLSNIFVCFDWSLAVSLTIVFMWKRPFSDVTILLLMIDWTLVKWWFDFSISVWCHSYISWWYPYSTRKQNLADQCYANKNGSSTNASIPFANKKAYEALTRRLAISAPMVERMDISRDGLCHMGKKLVSSYYVQLLHSIIRLCIEWVKWRA